MSGAIVKQDGGALLEQVLISGDLSKLKPEERVMYYKQVCESVGLNPLTKPFEYITLNGKLTLYALRACTEQLRQINGVSVIIVDREVVEDCYVVTARATDKHGRTDESIGAVPIAGIKGEARSNAMMKAETKAKRRVTLSICGLGLLDETEVGSIPGAVVSPTAGALAALPIKEQEVINETAAEVKALLANDQVADAYTLWQDSRFDTDQQVAFWSLLDSKQKGILGRMKEAENQQQAGTITTSQKKRLEALIKENKLDREGLKDWCNQHFGKGHFTDLTNDEYKELDAHIALFLPKAAAGVSPPASPKQVPSLPADAPPPAATHEETGYISPEQHQDIMLRVERAGLAVTFRAKLQASKIASADRIPLTMLPAIDKWIAQREK